MVEINEGRGIESLCNTIVIYIYIYLKIEEERAENTIRKGRREMQKLFDVILINPPIAEACYKGSKVGNIFDF